jgi:thiosulfate/3-mercaptopyruvate sulfurtransferase
MRSLLTGGVLAAVVGMAAAAPAPGTAPESPRALLVAFDALQARLHEPGLRLIDARPRADYDRGHLPGAVWVDPAAVERMAAAPGALRDRDRWAAWIESLGIGPDATVLVYDAKRQLDAARVWWLLGYLGVPRVGLVDGGFARWAEEGRPVSADAPAVAPRPFPVAFQDDRHATRAEVLAAIGAKSARVVDARTEGEYTGAVAKSKRGGHVPTACHLEWTTLVRPDGRFLPEPELRAKAAAAGVGPAGEPVITHCQGGGRAAVNAFVMERLGYRTRNYYESWNDWGNAEDTPVEAGPPPGAK